MWLDALPSLWPPDGFTLWRWPQPSIGFAFLVAAFLVWHLLLRPLVYLGGVPGPRGWPLVGNLVPFVTKGAHVYFDELSRAYGPVFKVWIGTRPFVVVTDPALTQRIGRMPNRQGPQLFNQLTRGDEGVIDASSIVVARDDEWKTLRLAWQPAFQLGSLERYVPLMNRCAAKLGRHLACAAAQGTTVDLWHELGNMTLDVVGTTAYGVDFHTLDEDDTTEQAVEGRKLVEAVRTMFESAAITRGSIYVALAVLMPFASRLWRWMAYRFPDRRFKRVMSARRLITGTSRRLINEWRADHPAPTDVTVAAAAPAGEAEASQSEPQKPAPLPAKRAPGEGIAPGSFLGMMLDARDRTSGEKLSDLQIISQADIFIFAGVETTASMLAFAIHGISSHPEVERRLLAEVDGLGRDREVAFSDMERFPYAEAVLKESLRLYPPATLLQREINKTIQLDGHNIPEWTICFAGLYTFQRDPKIWPGAPDFAPERFLPADHPLYAADLQPAVPNAYIPFGTGIRMCIGHRFAMQEAKIALVRLYQRFVFRLTPGQVPLKTVMRITLQPEKGVNVTVHERSAAQAVA